MIVSYQAIVFLIKIFRRGSYKDLSGRDDCWSGGRRCVSPLADYFVVATSEDRRETICEGQHGTHTKIWYENSFGLSFKFQL